MLCYAVAHFINGYKFDFALYHSIFLVYARLVKWSFCSFRWCWSFSSALPLLSSTLSIPRKLFLDDLVSIAFNDLFLLQALATF